MIIKTINIITILNADLQSIQNNKYFSFLQNAEPAPKKKEIKKIKKEGLVYFHFKPADKVQKFNLIS